MFTGLIEEIGIVKSVQKNSSSMILKISCDKISKEANFGDSIAVNGVCLTATKIAGSDITFDVMPETVKSSTLFSLTCGKRVNLEKSLTLKSALGGHLVYGDVDTTAKIVSIIENENATKYFFETQKHFLKFVALKGRVAIDGASLTVSKKTDYGFEVSLIPHSKKNLILGNMKVGDVVNVEFDILAKYLNELFNKPQECETKSTLTIEKLIENGFA